MRLIESVADSPFSPIAARDMAVNAIFQAADEGGWELAWNQAHEFSGRFNEGLEGWVFRHSIRVPIIYPGEGV